MLDFLSKLFKARETSPEPEKVQEVKEAPETPVVEQKWNYKLQIYDTPLYGCEQKLYHGAGMTHYMDALMELAVENGDYTCTKREFKKFLIINRRVYQHKFNPTKLDLVAEPENIHDKNAVKIILDDRHVGYIRSDETEGLVDLYNSDLVKRVQVVVEGGKYKILLGDGSYFDGSEPITDFDLKKDEAPISIKIYLDVAVK